MSAQVEEERPVIVHAFATGRMLLDRTNGELDELRLRALSLWRRGPSMIDDTRALRLRFHLTDLVRDLEDMPERGVPTSLVGAECLRIAVESYCALKRLWLPGPRDQAQVVEEHDRGFGRSIRACVEAGFSRSTSMELGVRALAELGGPLVSHDTRRPA